MALTSKGQAETAERGYTMKSELKDKSINIIVKDAQRLKELTKKYYDSQDQKEADELLDSMSWERNSINAKLGLMLETDIITIDEWSIAYRLINILT